MRKEKKSEKKGENVGGRNKEEEEKIKKKKKMIEKGQKKKGKAKVKEDKGEGEMPSSGIPLLFFAGNKFISLYVFFWGGGENDMTISLHEQRT